MKEYKDYMDRISGGSRLRDKIMNRIADRAHDVLGSYAEHSYDDLNYEQPVVYNPHDDSIMYAQSKTSTPSNFSYNSQSQRKAPKKRSRALLASLGLVACAAGILFGLLIVPMILNRPADILPENGILGAYTTPSPAPNGAETPHENTFHFNFFDNVTHRHVETSWIFETNLNLGREYHSYFFPAVDFYFDWYGAAFSSDHGYVELSVQESPEEWRDIPWPVSSRTSIRVSNQDLSISPGMILYADGPSEPQMSYVGGVPVMIKLYNWPGPPSQFYGTGDGQSPYHHNYRPDFPIVQFVIDFEINGVFYLIHIGDDIDSGKAYIEMLLPKLIAGPADLSVIENMETPNWGDFPVTLEEAQQDPLFGRFVPSVEPVGFFLDWAERSYTTHENMLRLQWRHGEAPEDIHLHIGISRVLSTFYPVSIDDRLIWDWSLHPRPFSQDFNDSIHDTPAGWTIWNPIFAAEDFTRDVFHSRMFWPDLENEDMLWHVPQVQFRILHEDNIMVTVYGYTIDADTLWEMLNPSGYVTPIFSRD